MNLVPSAGPYLSIFKHFLALPTFKSDHFCHVYSSLTDAEWPVISLNLEVMKLLELLVSALPGMLSEHQWDFIMCSMCSWVQVITTQDRLFIHVIFINMKSFLNLSPLNFISYKL